MYICIRNQLNTFIANGLFQTGSSLSEGKETSARDMYAVLHLQSKVLVPLGKIDSNSLDVDCS